jgi:hypothetical protein
MNSYLLRSSLPSAVIVDVVIAMRVSHRVLLVMN